MEAIKTKIVITFLCMALSLFIVPRLSAQQDVPQEVIKAAEEGLPYYLEIISKKNAPEGLSPLPPTPGSAGLSLKVIHGFEEDDPLDQAYLGEPFQYYVLAPDSVLNYTRNSDVGSLLSQTDMWYFPVMIGEKVRSILIVDRMNGVWEAVALGKAVLSRELGKIRKQWPTESGYSPLLIASQQAHEFLFTVPQYDSKNLTIISLQPGKEGEGKDYSKLEDSGDVIEALQPIIESMEDL